MGAWIDHSARRLYSASIHRKSLMWPHGILRVDLEPLKGTVCRTLTPIVLNRTHDPCGMRRDEAIGIGLD
jgi:hypothetical protein